ncbi:MAG: ATP-dependent DNA helicase RecQ [Saprospiraceae bacterium]|nr:ATP-dependent DNA helicase [Bacteroidia bacterium]NNE13587.1 ATP-dependent DNA helicase RecQ [Saprospiraceae bacterium]NNL92930.1 ATP-dependent DNA helicase RecQ [Saprospiraceae bacterium]
MEVKELGLSMPELKKSLNNFFGFKDFKLNQGEIIRSVLDGQDTFVIMPTGGGKSLCYQLPALIMEGTALIISPLIALMKNQVDSIRGFSDENSVAHFLNSSLNKTQMKEVKGDILSGKTKLVFIAPETLTKPENIQFFKEANVSFIAVDEAHCISEWGHDFRPEYRKIRQMVQGISDDIPIIALTATATPKVQSDIIKNLNMEKPNIFMSSFNRDNLFYEVRPKISKDQCVKEIVQFINSIEGKSGIIYVQSRKSTEDIAKVLQLNGINAAPYHAGLDSKTRNKVQDGFLMEEVNVIVATIAFGMGIDKPDVRFVIHYDIPKSIENYYQETGRGGRDGLGGHCLAFYSYKDIIKLEKFLRDKGVAEKELAGQLMEEIIAYSETSSCRRKFLLHYFGEQFEEEKCNKRCDNCKNPKETQDVTNEMHQMLVVIEELKENYGVKILADFMMGKVSKEIKTNNFDNKPKFGKGKEKGELFWHSILRQSILKNFVYKEIEQYGLLKLTDLGRAFIENPQPVSIPLNRDFTSAEGLAVMTDSKGGAALDKELLSHLKDLRKAEGKRLKLQPWVIFSEPALVDMSTYYPISKEDMLKISGVSQGKARKFAAPFLDLIKDYVEQNDIIRPEDFVMKQVANKSKSKVTIIQGIDRKLALEDIGDSLGLTLENLLKEMNLIVGSGTKLDINYYLDENLDESVIEDIYEYFSEAETDSYEDAFNELSEDDITLEEILMVRIKFLTEVAH